MLLTNSFPAKEYYVGAICSIFCKGSVLVFPLPNSLSVLSIKIHSRLKHGTSDLTLDQWWFLPVFQKNA